MFMFTEILDLVALSWVPCLVIFSDAPALSTDNDAAAAASAVASAADAGVNVNAAAANGGEQWDEEAMAATMAQKKAIAPTTNSLFSIINRQNSKTNLLRFLNKGRISLSNESFHSGGLHR